MTRWLNKVGKALAVAAVVVAGVGTTAKAESFGTKFACCRPESVSCLGGGGGTVWHKVLKDRALTQVDAKARCGINQMYWATHSCPADVACSNSTPPPSSVYTVTVRNTTNQALYVTHQTISRGTIRISSWYEVKGKQSREFKYADGSSCVAVSRGGNDWIEQQQKAGSIFTGTLKSLWSHPQQQTEITYAKGANGRYAVDLFVRNVRPRQKFENLDDNGVRNLFANNGVKGFKCFHAQNENHFVSVDN